MWFGRSVLREMFGGCGDTSVLRVDNVIGSGPLIVCIILASYCVKAHRNFSISFRQQILFLENSTFSQDPPKTTVTPPRMNLTPETKSALLPLPRELRDCIYGYLLTETFSVKTLGTGGPSSSLPLHRHTHLSILNVSKSTYEEAKRDCTNMANFVLTLCWPTHLVCGKRFEMFQLLRCCRISTSFLTLG